MVRKGSSPLQSIQNQILELEEKIEELRDKNKLWRQRYSNLKSRYDTLQNQIGNITELEALRLENSKLTAQLVTTKRNNKAEAKLIEIEKILKGR